MWSLFKILKVDSLINAWTGAGTDSDVSTHTQYLEDYRRDDELLRAYRYSPLARVIITDVVDRAFSAGYTFVGLTKEEEKRLEDFWKEFEIDAKLKETMYWGRLFGRAGMVFDSGEEILGELNGTPSQVKNVYVLQARSFDKEYFDPVRREVKIWRINGANISSEKILNNTFIDKDNIIITNGHILPIEKYALNGYRHDSILLALYDHLLGYDLAQKNVRDRLNAWSQLIYKIQGLYNMFAQGGDQIRNVFEKRMTMNNKMRSVYNALVLDADDQVETLETGFNGINDIFNNMRIDLAASSRMPLTVLFGQAQTGLSTEGTADQRNINEAVSQIQEEISRHLTKIIRILLGKEASDRVKISWFNSWNFTPQEELELKRGALELDERYYNLGILDLQEIARVRSEPYGYLKEVKLNSSLAFSEEEDYSTQEQEFVEGLADEVERNRS